MMTKSVAVAAGVREAAVTGIVVVGPLPPPQHGGTVATRYILESDLARRFRTLHVDTSDRRGLGNIGRFDAGNVVLALRHLTAFLRVLLTERPRLVYIPLAQNTAGVLRDLALLYPALLMRRSAIVHLHGGEFRAFYDASGPIMRALIAAALRRVRRVIVLAEPFGTALAGLVPAERIAVLPNGIRDVFAALPDRVRRADSPVRVLFIGNLTRAKGHLELIEAVRSLHARGRRVQLDLAGSFASDADQAAALRALRGLEQVVQVHGFVDDDRKRALLEAADIFALPSHSEGHPYVVLEAMAAGLPVVATALPGIAATVQDGETGILVPVRDVAALASAIDALAADPMLRSRLGAAGRARYEQHFSLARWSAGLTTIVSSVLEAA